MSHLDTLHSDKINALFWSGDINNMYLGHQMQEIFKDRIYDPYFVGKKDLIVMDLGANCGVFSIYAAPYAKQVLAFEPSPDHYEALSLMIDWNKLTNVLPHKLAISNTDGEANFYQLKNKTMNSLNPAHMPQSVPPIKVKTIRLDTSKRCQII